MRWYLSGRGGGRMSVSPCKRGTHVCPFGSFWFAISNTFHLSSACSMVETVMFSVQWWAMPEVELSSVHTTLLEVEMRLRFGSMEVSLAICLVMVV